MADSVHQHDLRSVHFEAVITRFQLDLAGMGGLGYSEGVSFRAIRQGCMAALLHITAQGKVRRPEPASFRAAPREAGGPDRATVPL